MPIPTSATSNSPTPLLVVCAVIENEDGQILSAQRGPGMSLAGKWEFPGGKVEPGEEPAAALIREIQEELGCSVSIIKPLTPSNLIHGRGALCLIPFSCTIVAGTPKASEHSALQWSAPEYLPDLDWAPADLPIVAEVIQLASSR
ncbi:MAG: (deoxy)nucleoside triphosphate pyrophosphohydrolase [Verrucomicrobiales bacterium]